jgi:Tfp pilus assembly protein PilX
MRRAEQTQQGSFLVAALVMIVVLTGIGIALASLASAQYSHTVREGFAQNAVLVAEAGIEQSVHQLNVDDDFAGYATPQVYFSNSTQGKGVFTTAVTTNADDSKTLIATGQVYRNSGDSQPYITRKFRVTVVGTTGTGYSVFSGPGGLILDGNSRIVNSAVYVGGKLQLNNNSSIGTDSNPLEVDVANQACPSGSDPGPTYPQVCTDGNQPISFSSNSRIYGTVCATGQTSVPSGNVQTGDGGAGFKPGCVAPPVEQPTYDRQAQIDAVATTASDSTNPYKCKTWPANFKLVGNVSIGGNCNTTISGNVYITGNLDIGGNATLRVADSAGSNWPVIIVDGTITTSGNVDMIANASGSGLHFISYKNATGDPGATVTGTALKQSQGIQTITLNGNGNMPGMIFVANWSKVYLGGNGQMGAVGGQTVELNGNGTVIFGTELSSGSKTWAITSYQRVY